MDLNLYLSSNYENLELEIIPETVKFQYLDTNSSKNSTLTNNITNS
jgi:hypothetical protein